MSTDRTSGPDSSEQPKTLDIVKQSWTTLWRHKPLWLFGIFVAGGSAGPAAHRPGAGAASAASSWPGWLLPVLIAAAILAMGVLGLHVLSEAALIDCVRRADKGQPIAIGSGLRNAKPHFGRVLKLKLLAAGTFLAVLASMAAPTVLAAVKILPLALGIGMTAILALVGVPVLLSVHFVYVCALRIAVIEQVPALEAVGRARVFLHGRLSISIELLVAWYLGAVVCGAVAAVAMVPAGVVAGVCYLLGGTTAAIIGAATLMAPVVLAALGALGTYRSSVWTLGYLKARQVS